MTTQRRLSLAVLVVFGLTALAIASSGGPPNARTGAPGESTCATCHDNLNVGEGALTLTAPGQYMPGDTVTIGVGLSQSGQSRWGFEATVLDSLAQAVGAILVLDTPRTQLSTAASGRQYVKHTATGTDPGVADNAPGWLFAWIAPAAPVGPITIYAAGNAADNDGSLNGDFIYTAARAVQPPCDCPCAGDPACDGVIANVQDVVTVVAVAFRGAAAVRDSGCPYDRVDLDCSGASNVIDVVRVVNVAFRGANPAAEFCAPCP